jgi:hypothetical protein
MLSWRMVRSRCSLSRIRDIALTLLEARDFPVVGLFFETQRIRLLETRASRGTLNYLPHLEFRHIWCVGSY